MGCTWSSTLREAWPSEHFRGVGVNAEHRAVLKPVWRPRDEHSKWVEWTTPVPKHDSGSWLKNKNSVCGWGEARGGNLQPAFSWECLWMPRQTLARDQAPVFDRALLQRMSRSLEIPPALCFVGFADHQHKGLGYGQHRAGGELHHPALWVH